MRTTLLPAILFISGFVAQGSSCDKRHPESYIFDREDILNEKQEESLNKLFWKHQQKTSNQIVVLTTPDYGASNMILAFATDFGNQIGVGHNELDNGVVIAFSKANRGTCIATGLGTQEVLPNEVSSILY
ncbi:MAG: TPM domain-containing protein [Owenweeksia sp.]|nr:TPM domain-containing protein [Owenweeksia sp.]